MPGAKVLRPAAVLLGLLLSEPAWTQRVSPYDSHFRALVLVPSQGSGLARDPYRPRFFGNPVTGEAPAVKLLGFSALRLPNNRFLVLCVAEKKADLRALIEDVQVVFVDRAITRLAEAERILGPLPPGTIEKVEKLRVRVP